MSDFLRKYSLRLIAAILGIINLFACSKSEVEETYNITPRSVEKTGEQQTFEVAVNSNGPWVLEASEGWIKVSPNTGNGHMNISVTLTENTSQKERYGKITLMSSDMISRSTVSITQSPVSNVDNIIIAHRGAYKEYGHPDNSVAALKKAVELNFYGSECDINITSDGQVIVLHGESFGGLSVLSNDYATLKNKAKLSNGETLPLLSDFIKVVMEGKGTKLFIDVKSMSETGGGDAQSIKAGNAATKIIKEMGAGSYVTFIIGRLAVFNGVAKSPDVKWPVAYMNHDITPQKFLSNTSGFTTWGNFDISEFGKNPSTSKFDAEYTDKRLKEWNDAGVELSFYNIDTEEQIKWYLPHSKNVKACSNYPSALLKRVKTSAASQ